MTDLRTGGVPEHFNLPWHLALEAGRFAEVGINLQWTNFSTGTGDMVKALAANELDVAIVLTEGIVNAINHGNPARIMAGYVATPLLWGIHAHAQSPIADERDLLTAKIGISRFGSGSHLMAAYYFQKLGRTLTADDFIVVNNMDGAREAMRKDFNMVFFWEQFTTQWLVNEGEFKRVGVCPTPWPCFMIAASPVAMREKGNALNHLLTVMRKETSLMLTKPNLKILLAERYRMSLSEAELWLSTVHWDTFGNLDLHFILDQTQQTLCNIGLTEKNLDPSSYLFQL